MCSHELAVTLLEPAGTFLPSWNLAGTLLGTLLELCRNLAATSQQQSCWVSISGAGSGASKMHALENWNTTGTSLERRWNIAGTVLADCWNMLEPALLEPCWKVAEILLDLVKPGTLLESHWNIAGTNPCWNVVKPCWNLAGTLLLEPLAGTFCWEPMRASISFFFNIVSCFA